MFSPTSLPQALEASINLFTVFCMVAFAVGIQVITILEILKTHYVRLGVSPEALICIIKAKGLRREFTSHGLRFVLAVIPILFQLS